MQPAGMQNPDTKPAVKVRQYDAQSVGTRDLEDWLDRYFYFILILIVVLIVGFCVFGFLRLTA